MAHTTVTTAPANASLKEVTVDRLACLLRHMTWADEALTRFERELADGWDYDEDLVADHPFGAYYQWCAFLCCFSEAALEQGLLSPWQMDAIRADLDASLPGMRACRQLLIMIPASLEEHPKTVDLFHDREMRDRLRRLHHAFRDALREEQRSRELNLLDQ